MGIRGRHTAGVTPEQIPDREGDAPEEQAGGKEKSFDPQRDTYEWIRCVIVAVIVCVLVFILVARVIDVQGNSMYPTLESGDKIIITRLAGGYEQGDIVVLKAKNYKKEPLVKRVIGTGGQTVELNFADQTVSVDGQVLDEPYIYERIFDRYEIVNPLYYDIYGIDKDKDVGDDWVRVTVPEGYVFVMGDNRNNSSDSRMSKIGFVDTRDVMGKVIFRIFPFNKIGAIYGNDPAHG